MRVVFTLVLGSLLLGCQAATASRTSLPSATLAPTETATPAPTATSSVIHTPTVSPAELTRRASPICENAFRALAETGPLTPPFAVMKVERFAETPVWELSHQLPHMGSLSASEVRTLFCISETRTQTGTYTNGSAAYQLFWDIRAVSWPGGKVIGKNSFTGSLPETKELASRSAKESSPYREFASWVFNQIDHPDFLHFKDAITSLAISPDGRLAAFGSAVANQIVDRDYQAQIYLFAPTELQTDLRTTAFVNVLKGHQGMVTSLAFSPDGSILASSGYDFFVKFWDVRTGALLGQVSITEAPNSLAFSPDGMKLAVAANLDVTILDSTSKRTIASIPGAGGNRLAFSPDGNLIYNNSSGRIKIIDLTAEQVILTFPDTFALIPTVSVAADGSILGVTYESPETVEGFALSPDGTQIMTYTIDRTVGNDTDAENVRLATWDAETGKYSSEVRFSGDRILAIQFSPEGSFLGIGNRNEVWIWEPSNWRVKEILSGHTGEIVDLAITSQETTLSASTDGTIRVWSLEK